MMMMIVGQSVEYELAGEPEVLGEILLQCHFVHPESHMTWPVLEPGPPQWEPATNRLGKQVDALLGFYFALVRIWMAHKSVNWLVKCTLKFIYYFICTNCSK
jgi:hypothetical protein